MSRYEAALAGIFAVVTLIGVLFAIEIIDERDTRRTAKTACFDAGYVEVMRVGDRWYCTRRRAGNDEIVEVKRLPRAVTLGEP